MTTPHYIYCNGTKFELRRFNGRLEARSRGGPVSFFGDTSWHTINQIEAVTAPNHVLVMALKRIGDEELPVAFTSKEGVTVYLLWRNARFTAYIDQDVAVSWINSEYDIHKFEGWDLVPIQDHFIDDTLDPGLAAFYKQILDTPAELLMRGKLEEPQAPKLPAEGTPAREEQKKAASLVLNQLREPLAELKAARERYRNVLLGEGYIIMVGDLTVDIKTEKRGTKRHVIGVEPRLPHLCTHLTKADAERIGALAKNGAGVQGVAIHVADALDKYISEFESIIALAEERK